MKSKRSPSKRIAKANTPPELPEELPGGRILERPDGFYWESKGELHGPFATLAEAEADMLSGGVPDAPDPNVLQETESELGINEWIDPDTGGPAEDSVPRIEDH
ncbi:MAG TPA: hypothetical protein VFC18_16165 [Burkholderiales bacterium]|nr:hypothetical protein [Burkholderiales bacterium]